MRLYQNQVFDRWRDDDSGAVFENIEFRKCHFRGCVLSNTIDPRRRSTFRNIKLVHCEQFNCGVQPGIFENVVLDGLKSDSRLGLLIFGAVFRHVVLKGKINHILVNPHVGSLIDPDPVIQRAFDEANAEFYAQTDWALDISKARFRDADIRGVPARLIRRDPETQFVVSRERAMAGTWRDIDLSKTYWETALEMFLQDGFPDKVLIACKGSRSFRKDLEGLLRLRDAGVVVS